VDINGLSVDAVLLDWVQIEYEKELIAVAGFAAFRNRGRIAEDGLLARICRFLPLSLTTSDCGSLNIMRSAREMPIASTLRRRNRTATDHYAVSRDRLKKIHRLDCRLTVRLAFKAQGADYIIITHADFIEPAQRLADYRRTQGYRTAVVRVDDVYDEFNHGIYDPRAIRAFVHYAYHHWQKPAPLFLLLFGDSTNLMTKRSLATAKSLRLCRR
jgi:hypothetical protein